MTAPGDLLWRLNREEGREGKKWEKEEGEEEGEKAEWELQSSDYFPRWNNVYLWVCYNAPFIWCFYDKNLKNEVFLRDNSRGHIA